MSFTLQLHSSELSLKKARQGLALDQKSHYLLAPLSLLVFLPLTILAVNLARAILVPI